MLNDLSPDILSEGHQKELTAYKGVMVSKSHAERDMIRMYIAITMTIMRKVTIVGIMDAEVIPAIKFFLIK